LRRPRQEPHVSDEVMPAAMGDGLAGPGSRGSRASSASRRTRSSAPHRSLSFPAAGLRPDRRRGSAGRR
jgi:hypothetical protein